jgi:hypothetical protein
MFVSVHVVGPTEESDQVFASAAVSDHSSPYMYPIAPAVATPTAKPLADRKTSLSENALALPETALTPANIPIGVTETVPVPLTLEVLVLSLIELDSAEPLAFTLEAPNLWRIPAMTVDPTPETELAPTAV